jgi:hypothetical protein
MTTKNRETRGSRTQLVAVGAGALDRAGADRIAYQSVTAQRFPARTLRWERKVAIAPHGGDRAFVAADDLPRRSGPIQASRSRPWDAVRAYTEAGFTEVALVQVGGDAQRPFLDWVHKALLPALRDL